MYKYNFMRDYFIRMLIKLKKISIKNNYSMSNIYKISSVCIKLRYANHKNWVKLSSKMLLVNIFRKRESKSICKAKWD